MIIHRLTMTDDLVESVFEADTLNDRARVFNLLNLPMPATKPAETRVYIILSTEGLDGQILHAKNHEGGDVGAEQLEFTDHQ